MCFTFDYLDQTQLIELTLQSWPSAMNTKQLLKLGTDLFKAVECLQVQPHISRPEP
jgi:hypothetical protein